MMVEKAGGNRRDNNRNRNHRVVFNETKNEFFDADYIILIREECDFDDEDDESVCTCYQHEMVRLTCCEPNCNCNAFEEFESPTPQSPKFAPPIEFVDAVTLSPPEGYKDMELEEKEMLAYSKQLARRGNPRAAVCKECSASNDYEGEEDEEEEEEEEEQRRKGDEKVEEKETEGQSNNRGDGKEDDKIDQSQQTTPTSPNNGDISSMDDNEPRHDETPSTLPTMGSPVSGILKGGKLWRQQSTENNVLRSNELIKTDSTSDDEGSGQRTVRFIEAEEKKDSCKSSPDDAAVAAADGAAESAPPPEPPTEMTLTFKLGNHVLVSNNSLKPNSAVRQLFPCATAAKREPVGAERYLVTAESLRAFEEAKRSKLPQPVVAQQQSDESIRRVIERNALRRSLVRYEPRGGRRGAQKTDNSLVERIKQLTCDVDDEAGGEPPDELSARVSPTGEEGHNPQETNQVNNKYKDRNFSPSSSSTTSSNSSSMSSTYRKITDLFGKRDRPEAAPHEPRTVQTQTQTLPDIAGPFGHDLPERTAAAGGQRRDAAAAAPSAEGRKQFLSTLAPLTACVSNLGNPDGHYYHLSGRGGLDGQTGGGEYTLEDIEDGLQNDDAGGGGCPKKITPDVLAGTPASESGDELAVFVQQDANRIERIKKKYENDQSSRRSDKDEDEDQDDYGFNRRPSVRGIKPRFGSTTEILQHIQNQIHLPAPNPNVSWPYYSETGINREDDANRLNVKMSYPQQEQQQYLEEKTSSRGYQQQYRPENLYQNCVNQGCYKAQSYIELDCNDYQTAAKARNGGRALSPPPQELSKTYHQTMVYIPYNHIEGYQPVVAPNAYQSNDYYRYNQNQINKKYIEQPYYQAHPDEQYCNANAPQQAALKAPNKPPYPNNYHQQQQQQHLIAPSSRSESPLGNFSMARATQTSVGCISSCGYYQGSVPQLRYRGSLRPPQQWKGAADYANKTNRHSFPSVRPRYPVAPEHVADAYPDDPGHHQQQQQQNNAHLLINGYYNYQQQPKESPAGSPTKARFIERGAPEGAASVSPQDSVSSPTVSSHTVTNASGKPLFYAMNV